MAQSFRSKVQAALAGVLISLLVLAFAVWGINDVFSPSSNTAVLSLGGKDVTTQDFDAAFRRELAVKARTEGRQMPHQEAYARGVHREVLQSLMTAKVIEIDADDLGIGVNARSAQDYVAEIEAFQDELTGKFSEAKMVEILARQRPPVTRAEFEADLIKDLRQRQTIPAINGGVVAPLEFAQQRYQYMTEQRKAKVLTFDQQAIASPPEPTDEELKSFITENPIPFTAPEYRRFTMIRLEAQDIIPDIELKESDLIDFFKLKVDLGEIGSTETRSIAQITATSEEVANQAVERLNNGEAPSDVASLLSLIEPVVYTDVVEDAVLDPETGTAAFSMKDGEAKAILGSLGNWYAVKVTGIKAAEKPDLEAIRPELEAELLKSKAEEKLFEITPKIETVLDEGGTLEDAAKAADVPYASIDFIDRSGTTRDELKLSGFDILPGVAKDETILKEIFTNDLGYPTDLFQTTTEGWAAIRVDDIVDSQIRPFEDVRARAKTLWTNERINEALDELMRDLTTRAKDGETLEALQASLPNGATLSDVVLIRSAPSQSTGPAITAGLLDAAVGGVERGAGPKPLTRQVAILTEVVENRDGLAGQLADILQDQATAAILSDLNNAYQSAVLAENPVTEYPDAVKRVLGLDTEE